MKLKTGEYTGSSDSGINEAIQNALQKAGEHTRIEVVETRSSHVGDDKRYYQVTVSTFAE
ncbi:MULTISPECIES: dodecin domain-containing protein [unclassified Legionella]|uniref:dodecin domain-containing protein n=1 Tax=unclassified Legionella TaxID=2622702 RepID=UPI001055192C|nr:MULTISPECIES: dodecin domain-containing protein [unclassified Legionella]MDI9818958.1 dodecin domain-containing protein [Legionella sp. PL877]